MKNTTIVTSIPKVYTNKSFFENTELFCRSVRRLDQDVPLYVFVPRDYNEISSQIIDELQLTVIEVELKHPDLLMSNILAEIPKYITDPYFIYFTTENLMLQKIDYDLYAGDDIYVTLTKIEEDNSYFNFEKTIHKLFSGIDNTNENMILEYMIAGKTSSTLWAEFNALSVEILNFLETQYDKVSEYYSPDLRHYILPAADLVALNIIYQRGGYSFKNFPNSFISLHSGLSEKYQPADSNSLFYQYSGLYHHKVDLFLNFPNSEFRTWLGKQLFAVNPQLAVKLCRP
jgi:hypothetical protein